MTRNRVFTAPFRNCQNGSALVEFALTVSVLLLIGAGLVEFGRSFWYYDAIAKGTRDAARQLSVVPTTGLAAAADMTKDMVVDAATSAAIPGFGRENVSIRCLPTPCGSAQVPADVRSVTVSANYELQLGSLFPFIGPSGSRGSGWAATLASHTTMPYMW